MGYEWLFRAKHQPFIIIFTACRTEMMALEKWQQADAEIGIGKYSCFPDWFASPIQEEVQIQLLTCACI